MRDRSAVTFRNAISRATLTIIGKEAVERIERDLPLWRRESWRR
jgi:hypothetical protein